MTRRRGGCWDRVSISRREAFTAQAATGAAAALGQLASTGTSELRWSEAAPRLGRLILTVIACLGVVLGFGWRVRTSRPGHRVSLATEGNVRARPPQFGPQPRAQSWPQVPPAQLRGPSSPLA